MVKNGEGLVDSSMVKNSNYFRLKGHQMTHRSVSLAPQVERLVRITEATIVKHFAIGDFSLALNLMMLARLASVLATTRQLAAHETMELMIDYMDGTKQVTEKDLAEYTAWVEKVAAAYSKRRLQKILQAE
jgi:hypothetical protein